MEDTPLQYFLFKVSMEGLGYALVHYYDEGAATELEVIDPNMATNLRVAAVAVANLDKDLGLLEEMGIYTPS